jgi:hypothetical protein
MEMNHAITIGEVLGFVGVVGGIFALGALTLGIIWLMNPFRSGH